MCLLRHRKPLGLFDLGSVIRLKRPRQLKAAIGLDHDLSTRGAARFLRYRVNTLPRNTKFLSRGRPYTVDQDFTVAFQHVTDSEIDDLQERDELMRDGFFLYDSAGLWIDYKLAHLVLEDIMVDRVYDDNSNVTLKCKRLRQYDNTHP